MSRIVPLTTLMVILALAGPGPVFAQAESRPAPTAATGTQVPASNEDRVVEPEELGVNEEAEPIDAYRIELILVTPRTAVGRDEDREPLYYRRPDQGGITPGIYDAPTGPLFEELERLVTSPDYEVQAYSSWRQIAGRTGASPRVRLDSIAPAFTGWVKVFDNNILLAEMDIEFIPGRHRMLVIEAPDPTAGEMELLLDLPVYAPELPSDDDVAWDSSLLVEDPAATPDELLVVEHESRYRINERRRVRFNEQHYFDHPRFGVLLRVERAEITVNETLGIAEEEESLNPADGELPEAPGVPQAEIKPGGSQSSLLTAPSRDGNNP